MILAAGIPEVRQEMVKMQRSVASSGKGAVLEGRDIGTVVLPDADFKFYLDAPHEVRASRRHLEFSLKGGAGVDAPHSEAVGRDMLERDRRDSTRKDSPLRMAPDAVRIDTGSLGADEVAEKMIGIVREGRGGDTRC